MKQGMARRLLRWHVVCSAGVVAHRLEHCEASGDGR